MVSPVPLKMTFTDLTQTPEQSADRLLDIVSRTLTERGSRYGTFDSNASVAQWLKTAFRGQVSWKKMNASQQEALDLIALKLSRILTGDPHYADNWVDIAGYAKLVADKLEAK